MQTLDRQRCPAWIGAGGRLLTSGDRRLPLVWRDRHRDSAAAIPDRPKPVGFGNCCVEAGIVVQLSFLSRPVCLPVLARLWRPRHTGKIAHARALAELIAAR